MLLLPSEGQTLTYGMSHCEHGPVVHYVHINHCVCVFFIR